MMQKWVAEAVASSGKSQAEVARLLHAQFNWADDRSVINKIIKGRRDVSADEAMHISSVTGYPMEGSVRRPLISSFDPDEHDAEIEQGAAYSRDRWTPHITGALPELDLKVGAGMGVVGDVINLPVGPGNISGHRVIAEWLIPEDYLRNEAKVQASVTIITEIIGDSMIPTYMPGDRVIVDMSQNKMVADTVYAISDGMTEPQIKRLQRVPFSDPPQVRIISDNPNLETFTVELDRLHVIGRICGHIARK
ncbi:S24 family peptidase [Pararhizobium sp. PWRC1-1]|uniref:S24 family peptidase n=1 Tax=Pararhizobium sp. PWRC1-1 TaxID=2804566 RepID=UPI003CF39886